MAYMTQIDTSSLSNQNISSALLVHTFTNTSRLRKVFVDVFATQLQGAGDYVVYATRQIAGAGAAYEVGARTTITVPSGVTSQMFPTIPLVVGATDVVKVYLTGLAGDTTTPDITTNVTEEWLLTDANGLVDIYAVEGTDASTYFATLDDATLAAIAALNNLSSAGAQTAAAAALTAYDPPTHAELTTALAALNDLSVADIIAGITEGSLDLQEILRIILAFTAGKASGGGSTPVAFRDQADTKARISMTVDASGNRTAVTVDGT